MFNIIKLLFKGALAKKETITFNDTRLGKLTCEFTADEKYFFWDTQITSINKNGKETAITVDGTLHSPDMKGLERIYWAIDSIEMILDAAQQEASKTYPGKVLNIRRDFYVEDISTYLPDGDDESDVEIELDSDEYGLLTIEFKEGKFFAIDYIE
ncbi:hypothetical protein [Flavobacterium pallidum]|uniref:Uncharacterized protein n=1 Tax=Flavobacterium pallidum TaxID=2172098 RepID=A0A2S1SHH1_9FLAO|nr:hypothetical protein [Flavobacterium pallidum]AWI25858.1 hypothetical protein HYN49_08060 [Flavobacterium pallidum]